MKRDKSLMEKILLTMEAHEHATYGSIPSIEGYSEEQIGYHCFLLRELGLVAAAIVTSNDSKSPAAIPLRITVEGYDYLDKQRESVAR